MNYKLKTTSFLFLITLLFSTASAFAANLELDKIAKYLKSAVVASDRSPLWNVNPIKYPNSNKIYGLSFSRALTNSRKLETVEFNISATPDVVGKDQRSLYITTGHNHTDRATTDATVDFLNEALKREGIITHLDGFRMQDRGLRRVEILVRNASEIQSLLTRIDDMALEIELYGKLIR